MDLTSIEHAVSYMEARLKEPLRAEEVAHAVHISYFHFHRLFCAFTGETIGNYIRKRRLTEAARELLSTERPILDIALDYQFESQEAFGRAFKKVYGLSPNSFRRKSVRPIMLEKGVLVGQRLRHRMDHISIEPTIVELAEDIQVVGIQGSTSLQNNRIPWLWSQLNSRREELRQAGANMTSYGICRAMSALQVGEITECSAYTEFVGCERGLLEEIPDGMSTYSIAAGKYAVFHHEGRADADSLRNSYEYIWGTWLFNTSYELDERDDFEEYGMDCYSEENGTPVIRIYIPVK